MDSTERFTDRVDDYVKFRPGYPPALIDVLSEEIGLTTEAVVVDVGSGTGLLSRAFLDFGNTVYGVEPNAAMRDAGEKALAGYSRFISVEGTAETTTLASDAADLVAAGQAFHWFDPDRARVELARVLKKDGHVLVAWNTWHHSTSPFLQGYSEIVGRHGEGVNEGHHAAIEKQLTGLTKFFGSNPFEGRMLDFSQTFDFEGLAGRLLSASYAPKADPKHDAMIAELRDLYERFEENGSVIFEMKTQLFFGRLS